MNENEDRKDTMTVREQIEWLLDRVQDEKKLRKILAYINRLLAGGRW